MKCPFCVAEGERSTLEAHGGFVTAMPVHNYYDEDGNAHHHDPNGSGTSLHCSRGHHYYPAITPCGSCDYGAREALLYAIDCPGSGTPAAEPEETRVTQRCPECDQKVFGTGSWSQVDGRLERTSYTIEHHTVNVESVRSSSGE